MKNKLVTFLCVSSTLLLSACIKTGTSSKELTVSTGTSNTPSTVSNSSNGSTSESSSQPSSSSKEIPASSSVSSESSSVSSESSSVSSDSSSLSSLSSSSSSASSQPSSSIEVKYPVGTRLYTCNVPTNTSQITDNCKAYWDAMKANQATIANDYVINDLRGTTNKDVDIHDYYDDGYANKSDRSKGVKLSWTFDQDKASSNYRVIYSQDSALNDSTTLAIDTDEPTVTIKNLYANTTYYWKVIGSNNGESDISSFKTGDYVRWIDCDRMYNVRDMGGYVTSSGKRVKQGLIYRGAEICVDDFGIDHTKTDTELAKEIFRNTMKIKVELDLRNDGNIAQVGGYSECAFAENGDIEYAQKAIKSYDSGLKQDGTLMKECFEILANAGTKPVYFHCHGGADRTGLLGWLLLGVLGCSYTDMVMDFELTSYSSIGGGDCDRCHLNEDSIFASYNKQVEAFLNITSEHGSTIKEQCEYYLLDYCGLSTETLAKLRNTMLVD